jgi:hypothetical protein
VKQILFQFCGSKDIKIFEKNHYVRKMTADGRTDKSKAVGEVRGHHGQQIHYLIWYETDNGWENVGAISGGSAVYATNVRDEFFHINKDNREKVINGIIDNTLFRLELHDFNLASKIVSLWRKVVIKDWEGLYGVKPYGFETFVEYEEIDAVTQRVGSLYLADNWIRVGETAGRTKNHVGKGLTGGMRGNPFTRECVPKKIVFCKWIPPFTEPQTCDYKSSWRSQTPEEKQLAKVRSAWRKMRVADSLTHPCLGTTGAENRHASTISTACGSPNICGGRRSRHPSPDF